MAGARANRMEMRNYPVRKSGGRSNTDCRYLTQDEISWKSWRWTNPTAFADRPCHGVKTDDRHEVTYGPPGHCFWSVSIVIAAATVAAVYRRKITREITRRTVVVRTYVTYGFDHQWSRPSAIQYIYTHLICVEDDLCCPVRPGEKLKISETRCDFERIAVSARKTVRRRSGPVGKL